jgi:hypothetical protein
MILQNPHVLGVSYFLQTRQPYTIANSLCGSVQLLIPHFKLAKDGRVVCSLEGLITAKARKTIDVMIGCTKVSLSIPECFRRAEMIYVPPLSVNEPDLVLPVIALADLPTPRKTAPPAITAPTATATSNPFTSLQLTKSA